MLNLFDSLMTSITLTIVAHRFYTAGDLLRGRDLFLLGRRGGVEGRGGDHADVKAVGVAGVEAAVLDLFDRASRFVLHDRCKGDYFD